MLKVYLVSFLLKGEVGGCYYLFVVFFLFLRVFVVQCSVVVEFDSFLLEFGGEGDFR